MCMGWREYRYGSEKPKAPQRIFSSQKRASLVSKVMDALRDWRRSPFENEGATVSGVRSALCLKGHAWNVANREAVALVAEAFRSLGVERPTEVEGQVEYAISSDYCAWCHSPIEDDSRNGSRRFCSSMCARRALANRNLEAARYDTALYSNACRLIAKERAPAKLCAYCSREFRSDVPSAKYCSPTCAATARRLPNLECVECGKEFHPFQIQQRFCSLSCRTRAKNKQRYQEERKRCLTQVRQCIWCDSYFRPQTETADYCSISCRKHAWQTRRGDVKLSSQRLDYLLRLSGANVTRADDRPLSPLGLDWLFLQAGCTITAEVQIAA